MNSNLHRIHSHKPGERIGLALGGGFARGIAHVGVLRVLERYRIPIHCVAGVSAGAVVGAAFASGATASDIEHVGMAMRLGEVARWRPNRMGLACSKPIENLMSKLLKRRRFEETPKPLGVVATDLSTGAPVMFRDRGDVSLAVRASCSFPGVFQPVEHDGHFLVDGAVSVQVPAQMCRAMGATRVISVLLPPPAWAPSRANLFSVLTRCFQIVQAQTEVSWRAASDVVIAPEVGHIEWKGFDQAERLIAAGEQAAEAAVGSLLRLACPPLAVCA